MRGVFVALLVVTGIIGAMPSFARAGAAGIVRGAGIGVSHGAGAGIRRGAGVVIRQGGAVRHLTPRLNAIPAPLPEPAQAPVINGPLTSNGMPSMGNGLR
jgi:hypothetical protein